MGDDAVVTRDDVAAVLVGCLGGPATAGKNFELFTSEDEISAVQAAH